MTTDYDIEEHSYDADEHRADEIDIEYAWAFGLIAVILLVALVVPIVAG